MNRNRLFTMGYERHSLESFFAALAKAGVQLLADVRQRASSRRPGFGKTALSNAAAAAGIEYWHFPMLGTPSTLRTRLREKELDLGTYLNLYGQYVDEQETALAQVEKLINEKTCCLLCVESDPNTCHRSVLAGRLVRRSGEQLDVRHL